MTKSSRPVLLLNVDVLVLLPVLIGAGVGTLVSLGAKRKSPRSLATAAMLGGFAAMTAWSSRRRALRAAHTGLRGINTARDYYYVARHPIDYA